MLGFRLIEQKASEHHNGSEDRRFKFQCSFTDNTVTVLKPTWSAFLNNFDQPLDYTCPKGQVMVGQYSVHGNGVEDRRFKARCAEIKARPPHPNLPRHGALTPPLLAASAPRGGL